MSDPPKRTESQELTVVRPRVSNVPGPTIEMLADIERARRDAQDDVETLVACPGCEGCAVCHGSHMVSAERAAEHARQAKILTELDEPTPPDSSPPEAA